MSAFKYFTNIEVVHEACEGRWRATVRVQCRGPGMKTTEVEARVALVCASTDNGRSLPGTTNLIGTVVDCFASGSGAWPVHKQHS